jgi:spore germination cell wall hydrolase CwlJ-like protein
MRLVSEDAIAIVTIYQEAEGEPFAGKVAVGEVIRNRATRKYSSDGTVIGTCLRASQFSGWNTNSKNRTRSLQIDSEAQSVQDCVIAWEQSRASNLTLGAVLYLNPDLVNPLPSWAQESKLLATIGNHKFYAA